MREYTITYYFNDEAFDYVPDKDDMNIVVADVIASEMNDEIDKKNAKFNTRHEHVTGKQVYEILDFVDYFDDVDIDYDDYGEEIEYALQDQAYDEFKESQYDDENIY